MIFKKLPINGKTKEQLRKFYRDQGYLKISYSGKKNGFYLEK